MAAGLDQGFKFMKGSGHDELETIDRFALHTGKIHVDFAVVDSLARLHCSIENVKITLKM